MRGMKKDVGNQPAWKNSRGNPSLKTITDERGEEAGGKGGDQSSHCFGEEGCIANLRRPNRVEKTWNNHRREKKAIEEGMENHQADRADAG